MILMLSGNVWTRAYTGLTALSAIIHFPVLFLGRSYFISDIHCNFFPSRALYRTRILSGELPLWTNGYAMGQPFLADPSTGSLYPLNLLLLLPCPWSLNFLLFAHQTIFGAGLIAAFRKYGLGASACFLGAAVCMTGGYISSMLWSGHYLVSVAWLPWVIWSSKLILESVEEKNIKKKGTGAVCLLTFFFCMQALAGDPQATILSVFVFISSVLSSVFIRSRKQGSAKPVGIVHTVATATLLFSVTVVLSLLVSAVQILPTIQLMLASLRIRIMDYNIASSMSISPLRLLELFSSNIWGDPFSLDYEGFFLQSFESRAIPWPAVIYMGVPTLVFCAAGIPLVVGKSVPYGTKLLVSFCTILMIFGLAMSLGRYGPVYRIFFDWFPGGRLFRYPFKYLLLFSIGMSGISAAAFSHILKTANGTMLLISCAVFLTICLVMYFCSEAIGSFMEDLSRVQTLSEHLSGRLESDLLTSIMILALLFLCGLGIASMKTVPGWIWALLLIALCLTDEVKGVIPDIYHTVENKHLAGEPRFASVIRSRGSDDNIPFTRLFRTKRLPVSIDEELNFNDKTRLRIERDSLQPNTWIENGFEYVQGFTPVPSARTVKLINSLQERPHMVMDILSTNYLVLPLNKAVPLSWVVPLVKLEKTGITLWKNRNALPYARVVPVAVNLKDDSSLINRMKDPDFDPRKEVLFSGLNLHRKGGTGKCHVIKREPENVEVECNAPDGGYLVLADAFYDGWRAFIDEKEVPIMPAYMAIRAVWLPGGNHVVKFEYMAPGLVTGTLLSILGLLLLFSLCIYRKIYAG